MKHTLLKIMASSLLLFSNSLWATSIITSVPNTKVPVGTSFEYWVKSDATQGENVQYSLKNSRKGMRIQGKSGLITWTPTAYQLNQNFTTTINLKVKGTILSSQELDFEVIAGNSTVEEAGIFVTLSTNSNTAEEGTAQEPFSDMKKACAVATDTNTSHIYVRGSYTKGLLNSVKVWNCYGTKSNPIVVSPWGNEQVIVAFIGRSGFNIRNSHHTTLQNFEVIGANNLVNFSKSMESWWTENTIFQGTGISISKNTQNIIVQNNIVHDTTAAGIKAITASSTTIRNNIVYNCAWWTTQGTTGIGITLATPNANDTDNTKAYNKMLGNLLFSNESRIYSRVWQKHAATLHVDEGEAILVQESNVGVTGGYEGRYLIKNNFMLYNGKTAVVNKASHVDIRRNSFYLNGTTTGNDLNYTSAGLRVNASEDVKFVGNVIDADIEHGLLYSVYKDSAITKMSNNYGRGAFTPHAQNEELPNGFNRINNDLEVFSNPNEGNFTIIFNNKTNIAADQSIMDKHLKTMERYAIKLKPTNYKVNHFEMKKELIANIPENAKIDQTHYTAEENKPYLLVYNLPADHPYVISIDGKERAFKLYFDYDENLLSFIPQ